MRRGDFAIEPVWQAIVEWLAWYEDSFEKRTLLNSRHAMVGYTLNDSMSASGCGQNQLHRMLDFTKPNEAGMAVQGLHAGPQHMARHADRPVLQRTASAERFVIAERNMMGFIRAHIHKMAHAEGVLVRSSEEMWEGLNNFR